MSPDELDCDMVNHIFQFVDINLLVECFPHRHSTLKLLQETPDKGWICDSSIPVLVWIEEKLGKDFFTSQIPELIGKAKPKALFHLKTRGILLPKHLYHCKSIQSLNIFQHLFPHPSPDECLRLQIELLKAKNLNLVNYLYLNRDIYPIHIGSFKKYYKEWRELQRWCYVRFHPKLLA